MKRRIHFQFHTITAPLVQLFFQKGDPNAKGRLCMQLSSIFNSISANLTGGVFYTGFLIGNDIDITRIGIITFIPYIASILSLFSPVILERFEKRRWILAGARIAYYVINILGITLLPYFSDDPNTKVIGFAIIVFLANAINFLFGSGYSVWHINFLPNNIRANYFSVSQFITNFFTWSVVVISSIVADSLEGTPEQMRVIIILRYVALLLAFLDCLALLLPKEFPYEHSGKKLNPLDVIRIPVKNRKYLLTMLIYYVYAFGVNIPSAVLTTYLLQNVGVSYSLINGINAVFCIIILLFSGFWMKIIRKVGWIKTFGLSMLLNAPTYFLYAFIAPGNYVWLYITVRVIQHIAGVGTNISASNLPYINTPEEDKTAFMSFHNLAANACTLGGMMLGTLLVSVLGDFQLSLGFCSFDVVQLLVLAVGVSELLAYFFAKAKCKELEPEII